LNTAIEQAKKKVAAEFGLGKDFDVTAVQPSDLTENGGSQGESSDDYGAVLAGISQRIQEAKNANKDVSASDVPTLVKDMAKDFANDGEFDGETAEGALNTALEITPKQAKEGLQTAMENFMKSDRNKSGTSMSDLSLSF
jgi:hypothetical protein